ncbi:TPA: hypothetical protein N0F65_002691 [Lagenidium giganteum]|uniref:Uncharacterized protein n=1 Tax=Lagenidium giganteum TaxID=4803 RepID=A0AAV2Z470_9STRA|nr:TPA: hypothetical protein N0F65_002691 [Lagenidium giganteum]
MREKTATAKRAVCGCVICVEDIKSSSPSATWTKYERFKLHKENDRASDCPFWNHTQVVAITDDADLLECVCESCHEAFCFIHSCAHTSRACVEYEKQASATEKINRTAIGLTRQARHVVAAS